MPTTPEDQFHRHESPSVEAIRQPPISVRTDESIERTTSRRAAIISLLAPALGSCAVALGVWLKLPLTIACLAATAVGWLLVVVVQPWRVVHRVSPHVLIVSDLTRKTRNIVSGERDLPIQSLVVDRNDELGDLSRLLHELAVEVIDARRQAKVLRRNMGDNIRKETDRATAHLQKQASTDPLTGLGNRRALEHILDELAGPDSDPYRTVSAMAIDLDRFKAINDTLGHEAGDRCLTFLASLLKSSLRREDCPIRLGGDEFVVLMPDVPLEQGSFVAERLRSLYAQMPWPHREVQRPTLSIGIAGAMIGQIGDGADLIRDADAALYESKRLGRATHASHASARSAA